MSHFVTKPMKQYDLKLAIFKVLKLSNYADVGMMSPTVAPAQLQSRSLHPEKA